MGCMKGKRGCARRVSLGFLGPIGDDLPSLIPLLFALTLFFYVFTFTWGVFDKRDAAFNDALAILRVGSALKANSYISNIEKFRERCETAKEVQRMRFLAGLLEVPTGPGESVEEFDIEKLSSGDLHFFSADDETFECSNAKDEMPEVENKSIIVRFFPVALEFYNKDQFYVKPMLLVVIAWK